jgi:Tfp pilus assembly protein PilN
MRAVNLLPDPRTDKRHADRPSRLQSTKAIAAAAGAVLVLVAAVSGVAFTKARSDVSDRQSTLNGLQAELAGVQATVAVSAAAADQTQAHLAAVSTAASGRIAWDGLLDQLSRVMPRGAWLESLQGTNAAPAAPAAASTSTTSAPVAGAAPTGFVVTGYARSQATVARALDRLVLMPALSDVSLQTSERSDVGTKKAFKFTIGANVRSAGGTP